MKIIKELVPYVIIVFVVVLLRAFIITPVRVNGDSMNQTLKDGEILLLEKYDKNFERFDIVVLKYNDEKLVKRIIGMPGENVQYLNNILYINGEKVSEEFLTEETYDFDLKVLGYDKIPENYYFVVGDNRSNSLDSRLIGLISKEDIEGKAIFRIFPFNKFGNIKSE